MFEPEQRRGALRTLYGYTTTSATAAGEEAASGRIALGGEHLTGLSADVVETPVIELLDVAVQLIMVAGRVVHRNACRRLFRNPERALAQTIWSFTC